MKFRRLILASLTSLVASVPTSSELKACEQCRGSSCHTCSAASDDRGLLDLLNAASHRLQPRLPRVNMPRVPSLDSAFKLAWAGRPAASCGCEVVEANCGCELHEPSCGCESPTACHCQSHSQAGSAHNYEYTQPPQLRQQPGSFSAIPQQTAPQHTVPYVAPQRVAPQPEALPTPEPAPRNRFRGSEPISTPRTNSHPPAALPQAQPQAQPQPPARIPAPVPTPIPDSQVDPFRDDTATRIRQIPARTIEYRQTAPSYRQNYDPQARTGGTHLRLSDDSGATADSSALADHSSSRSRPSSPAGPSSHRNTPPSVVTASGSSLQSYDQRQSQPTAVGPTNPLRRN